MRRSVKSFLFVLPFSLVFFVFLFFPFFYAFYLSFFKVTDLSNIFENLKFVGLKNYLYVLRDKEFLYSIWLSLKYGLMLIPLNILLSISLALLLKGDLKINRLYRTLFFMPFVLDAFVVGVVWTIMYAGRYGLLVNILKPLIPASIYNTGFLGNPNTAMPAVVIAICLKNIGFGTILYTAALNNISPDIEDAAKIDGATGLKKFFKITFPLVSHTTTFLVITGIIGAFSAFSEFFAMTGGGPVVYKWGTTLGATKVSGYYLYNHIANLRLGVASATSFLLLILTLAISMIYSRLTKE
uniref:Sugar ABC transporter permease n=1 Tax=candidate division WOR-3 bacterium TaxID=2052148 RepID=A0A7V4E3X5_UNCW3